MNQTIVNILSYQIVDEAKRTNVRSGQYLYNKLPQMIKNHVFGAAFDPFYYDMTQPEIRDWMIDHLIFDVFEIKGLIHDDVILWEK